MSQSLQEFKNMKIKYLINIYNKNVNILSITYNNLLRQVLNNKILRNKAYIIINEYNNKLNNLKNKYNNDINLIKNMVEPLINNAINKNALLIGINYINTSYQLFGCINDVNNINNLLSSYNFKSIKMMTDESTSILKPTRANILNEITNMLMNSVVGDILFLFYSGHGSYTIDVNSNETTGYDQMIVPIDLQPIVDDELKLIINKYLKKGVLLIALFDSCFSGSVLDLKYQWIDSLDSNNLTENINENETTGNVIMISGCSDIQTSADALINNQNQGAMTWSFLQSLKQNITWRELLKNMRELLKNSQYSQTPQLTSGSFFNIDSKVFL
jgi:hypothetical protein